MGSKPKPMALRQLSVLLALKQSEFDANRLDPLDEPKRKEGP